MTSPARFLKTGHNDRTGAYGPMAEVVQDSTSKMKEADLKAMAVYIKSLPASSGADAASSPDEKAVKAGAAIYSDSCAACRQPNGGGVKGFFPSLKGDSVVQSKQPTTMIRLVLNGGHGAWTQTNPNAISMPSFGWKLSNDQIASLVTFLRSTWGNSASPVSSNQVKSVRNEVKAVSSAN